MKRRNLTTHYLELISLQSYQHSLLDVFILCIIVYFLLMAIVTCLTYNVNKKKQNVRQINVITTIVLLYHTYRLVVKKNGVCMPLIHDVEPLTYYYFNIIISTIIYINIVIVYILLNHKSIVIYKFLIYTFFFKYCIYFMYFDVCDNIKLLYDPYGDDNNIDYETNFVKVSYDTDLVDTYIQFIVLVSVFVVISELLDNVIVFIRKPTMCFAISSFVLVYFINKNISIYTRSMFYSRLDLYLLGMCIYTFMKSLLEISM
ncbi:protein E7B [Proboscivirus elephantidbeta4]|uniref:Protein E7B n=1 Tax=Elephant endotheliotropic herpesvirus 4 TaxID=548914 RepID=A0A0S1TP04_9BETA|nr:protein E7B [Elephant endotheliotropic herpesvirus 4]ALM25938.1 protein E7B [Elephant endotheliotropic herpesvirus 4]